MGKKSLCFLVIMSLCAISCTTGNQSGELLKKTNTKNKYFELIKLNSLAPYRDYIGKTVFLQRDTLIYIDQLFVDSTIEYYLDGTDEPEQNRTITQRHISTFRLLPKGHPICITDVYGSYSKRTFYYIDKPNSIDQRNTITAIVKTKIPPDMANELGLKNPTITIKYTWATKGGSWPTRTFVTTHLRRAPWEPDSIPDKRYVGPLGNKYQEKQAKQE